MEIGTRSAWGHSSLSKPHTTCTQSSSHLAEQLQLQNGDILVVAGGAAVKAVGPCSSCSAGLLEPRAS